MNTYYLFRNKHGRVILDSTEPDWKEATLIREITADSWLRARLTIGELEFEQREGHGFF